MKCSRHGGATERPQKFVVFFVKVNPALCMDIVMEITINTHNNCWLLYCRDTRNNEYEFGAIATVSNPMFAGTGANEDIPLSLDEKQFEEKTEGMYVHGQPMLLNGYGVAVQVHIATGLLSCDILSKGVF